MRFTPTALPEVILVEPDVYKDGRGRFVETWHERKYREGGIPAAFVQDNESSSVKGTLRGLHSQRTRPQGKLVRVLSGEIYDIAVDIRRGSPTFLKWVALTLTAESAQQVWVPPGFAHGFLTLSEEAHVEYKCTGFYDPADDLAVAWDDPDLAIDWPVRQPLLSERDRQAPRLRDVMGRLPRWGEPA